MRRLIRLESEPSTRSLLPEAMRIILESGLQGLVSIAVAAPVVLAVVGVVHEQRSVHIRQPAFLDESLCHIVESVINLLEGRVDLVVVGGEEPGEIKLEDNVVYVPGEVNQVLHSVSHSSRALVVYLLRL